jgi:hypothetical protein
MSSLVKLFFTGIPSGVSHTWLDVVWLLMGEDILNIQVKVLKAAGISNKKTEF